MPRNCRMLNCYGNFYCKNPSRTFKFSWSHTLKQSSAKNFESPRTLNEKIASAEFDLVNGIYGEIYFITN